MLYSFCIWVGRPLEGTPKRHAVAGDPYRTWFSALFWVDPSDPLVLSSIQHFVLHFVFYVFHKLFTIFIIIFNSFVVFWFIFFLLPSLHSVALFASFACARNSLIFSPALPYSFPFNIRSRSRKKWLSEYNSITGLYIVFLV